jgi:CheY-like chemotaxis protein
MTTRSQYLNKANDCADAAKKVRALSAEQALLALLADEFALLILDVRMPDVTGFELARMIKARKKYANVPIMIIPLTCLSTSSRLPRVVAKHLALQGNSSRRSIEYGAGIDRSPLKRINARDSHIPNSSWILADHRF